MPSKNDADGSLQDVVEYVDNTNETTVDFQGKTYWFEYKQDIPARVKQNIVVQYSSAESFDDVSDISNTKAGDLQVALLEEHIVDSSVNKLSALLKKAPSEFIEPLAEEILDQDTTVDKGN
jgi:hypothetical protein